LSRTAVPFLHPSALEDRLARPRERPHRVHYGREGRTIFKGTVTFRARIKGHGLTVSSCAFNPRDAAVERVEIEGPKGDELLTTVYLASVATREEGKVVAAKVNTAALDRIAFFYNIAIDDAQATSAQFSLVNPPPGNHIQLDAGELLLTGEHLRMVIGISAPNLRAQLEKPSPAGEPRFGLFRAARQSTSPVEEFMHLYNLLLMICNDDQGDVDAFVRKEEPGVPQTPSPRHPGVMETVYTRLRNELGHPRKGVDLHDTKAEMANRVGGLISLTKRAIEQLP